MAIKAKAKSAKGRARTIRAKDIKTTDDFNSAIVDILDGKATVAENEDDWDRKVSPRKAKRLLWEHPWAVVIVDFYYGFVFGSDKSYEWFNTKAAAEEYLAEERQLFNDEFAEEVDNPYDGTIAYLINTKSEKAETHLIGLGIKEAKELRPFVEKNWESLAFSGSQEYDLLGKAKIKRPDLKVDEDDLKAVETAKRQTAAVKAVAKAKTPVKKAPRKPSVKAAAVRKAVKAKTPAKATTATKPTRSVVARSKAAKAKAKKAA